MTMRTIWGSLLAFLTIASGGCPPPDAGLPDSANENATASENGNAADSRAVLLTLNNPTRRVFGDSIELTWQEVLNASAYRFYIGFSESPELIQAVAVNRFTIRDLQSCKTYYWRVEAITNEGVIASATQSFKTVCGAELPLDPAYPSPANNDFGVEQKPVLTWQGSFRAEEYDVYFGRDVDPPFVATTTAPRLEIRDALAPGALYNWRIVAKNEIGDVESATWQFRVLPIPGGPRPPRNVAPANLAVDLPTRLNLDWARSSGADGYDVLLDTLPIPAQKIGATTETKYDVSTPLEHGTTYYWQIVARHGDQRVSGPVWTFRTSATPLLPYVPARPIPRDNAIVGAGEYRMSWERDANADEYDVYLSDAPTPVFVATVTDATHTVQLEAGKMYAWSITARNSVGERRGPTWHFVTTTATTVDPGNPDQNDDDDDDPPPMGPQAGSGNVGLGGPGCLKKLELNGRGISGTGLGSLGISADGTWVAFSTRAAISTGDTNNVADIYVANLDTGEVQRVSVKSDGSQAASGCDWPHISDDGRFVLFTTRASLDAIDTDNFDDVYLHDRATHQTRLVSNDVTTAGALSVDLSGDGNYALYSTGRERIMLWTRTSGALTRADVSTNGALGIDNTGYGAISADGRYLAFNADFPDDTVTNRIWLRDRQTGQTIDTGYNGLMYASPLSADGKTIVISEVAALSPQRVQVRLIRPLAGTTQVIGTEYFTGGADDADVSWLASISGDGNVVTFNNYAQLRANYPLLHAYNVQTGEQWNVSESAGGTPASGLSDSGFPNHDGSRIFFNSVAGNLVSNVPAGNLYISECGP